MKKVVVLLIVSLVLNSCGNKSSDSSSSKNKLIKTKPELEKYTKSHKYSILELLEMLKLTPKELENHILCKGYESTTSEEKNYGYCYEYVFTKSNPKYNIEYYTFMNNGDEFIEEVRWTTEYSDDFQVLKNEIKKLGYKIILSEKNDSSSVTWHENDSLLVALYESKAKGEYVSGLNGSGLKKRDITLTFYTIKIGPMPKEYKDLVLSADRIAKYTDSARNILKQK
jgi:hypothetical protein